MNKLIVLVLLLSIGPRVFAQTEDLAVPAKQQELLTQIGKMLERGHYHPRVINDEFSMLVWTKYIQQLDPRKQVFLKEDLTTLAKYQTTLDDEIHGAPIAFLPAVLKLYQDRLEETYRQYELALTKPNHYNKKEKGLPAVTSDFAASESVKAEASGRWIKLLVLQSMVSLKQQSGQSKSGDPLHGLTDVQLEDRARNLVRKQIERQEIHVKSNLNEEKQFAAFVEVIVRCMDPHSDYFPPVENRGFQETVSGKYFGAGLQLKMTDGIAFVGELEAGGPAAKSGQIEVGDIITAVGEGLQGDLMDITGMTAPEIGQLIRGDKGTALRLSLKKANGTSAIVLLAREEMSPAEGLARSAIVKQGQLNIGYIALPKFYEDNNNPDGPHCAQDVATALVAFRKANINGLVIDLRNNPGGSLTEVVRMVELFIDNGPAVQVKGRNIAPVPLAAPGVHKFYIGPLVIMVNELTASAAEIFAAAMQDYHRGIIIGSASTFGKGTVQIPIPIGNDPANGALKLTTKMFYRVNGSSTQRKGVRSDVVIPDLYQFQKVREKDNDGALPWDSIAAANYNPLSMPQLGKLQRLARERIKADSGFASLDRNFAWLGQHALADSPLDLAGYLSLETKRLQIVKQDDRLLTLPAGRELTILSPDSSGNTGDLHYIQFLKKTGSDIYVDQAVKVVSDMIVAGSN
jgi:carboxyl-terminal processing protease